MQFKLGIDRLTVKTVLEMEKNRLSPTLNKQAVKAIEDSRQAVDEIVASDRTVYGINTGFGPLCTTKISKKDALKLQENILRSHSVGVGDTLSEELTRMMLITKLQSLSFGYSGISMEVMKRIQWHLENRVTPVVPDQGSVGASGDLAPLAHLFLPLIGLGQVLYNSEVLDSVAVLDKHHLKPIALQPKEGLALINGTQFMVAHATLATHKLANCLDAADIIGAMSLEGVLGSVSPFHEKLHDLRPFDGSRYVAQRLRTLLTGSEMVESHADCGRVQDPYSIRCMPQVHGASRNAWRHLREVTETELNSVTDNPIILSKDEPISGGNFHGQLLALPLDYATLAAAEVGNISDRRTYLLLQGEADLPKLLMKNTGINSGFMIPQYTSAALVSENKSLCFPASADSIPTSLGQEDHVSMGSISGRKTLQVIRNLENILAVELICAAQAFDYRKPLKSGAILEACHEVIRSRIDHAEEDRVFADDIQVARNLIRSGELVKTANSAAEQHNIHLKGTYHEHFSIS